MFDKSNIGYSFAPFTIEVYRNKIAELNQAIGDINPIYQSRAGAQAAGLPDVPMSPTTPTVFNFWGDSNKGSEMTKLGIDVKRILHGEEEYEYLAPVYPHDVLTGVTTVVDGTTRRGSDGSSLDIITTETRYTNQHNQHVLSARSTIVIRS